MSDGTNQSGGRVKAFPLDADEIERLVLAMARYRKNGGARYQDFKAELAAIRAHPDPTFPGQARAGESLEA